jgi:hypothetical protein
MARYDRDTQYTEYTKYSLVSFYDDRALSTCGVSLSQIKGPFSTQYASSSFTVCMWFFFSFYILVQFF